MTMDAHLPIPDDTPAMGGGGIVDQAIAWHLRQETMAAEDWEAFVIWLEADPAHARAFDTVAAQDRLVAEADFVAPIAASYAGCCPIAANDDAPASRHWWRWAGGSAVAAALALWLTPMLGAPGSEAQVYRTRDGERRDVRLADGTQIAMNGGTVLRVDAGHARSVHLDRGEATLQVVHDPARPFTLYAGDQAIRDVGTTFDVTHGPDGVSIAVAEGEVLFQPEGAAMRLTAGQALTREDRTGRIVRTSVAPEAVGGWRDGMLGFDAAPLAEVAASLRRLHGTDIVLGGDLSRRPFTGMIHVTGAADRDVPHLADLIGATWRREGERWVLAERANAAR
ncbi:MAG: FecR domain-containing protein [Sphingomonas taxi]